MECGLWIHTFHFPKEFWHESNVLIKLMQRSVVVFRPTLYDSEDRAQGHESSNNLLLIMKRYGVGLCIYYLLYVVGKLSSSCTDSKFFKGD